MFSPLVFFMLALARDFPHIIFSKYITIAASPDGFIP
jgi:hypothetical protein